MSKDDLNDLPPIGKGPLDGDLLNDDAAAAAGTSLTIGDPLAIDEGEPISAPTALPTDEPKAEPEPEKAEKPEKPKSPGFAARLAQSNPYTVLLFVSLVALLIGILCLALEWGSYNFEIKPSAGLLAPPSSVETANAATAMLAAAAAHSQAC